MIFVIPAPDQKLFQGRPGFAGAGIQFSFRPWYWIPAIPWSG
jgi:hypothetical protein